LGSAYATSLQAAETSPAPARAPLPSS
jgi:hypothetical protein